MVQVTFEDFTAAETARDALDGHEIMDRAIKVNNARQMVESGGDGEEGAGDADME